MNPFLRRATEYIRDTAAFLSIASPEPLKTFIARHSKIGNLLDLPVRIIGSPGTGKTMMASLVEFRLVEAVLRDQSSEGNRAMAAALTSAKFATGDHPLIAAVRLPMESEYRELWELPYDANVKTRLMLALIQARAVLGWIRTLTVNKYRDIEGITFVPRPDAEAQLVQIGGADTSAIRDRARQVEQLVYTLGASLVAPKLEDIPAAVQAPYQPFEVIREIEISWHSKTIAVRPLVILDDVHNLHPEQYASLFRALAKRENKIGRWLLMRMDALSPSAAFRSSDDDALPGLKHDRDFLDIVMESTSNRIDERKRFRRMAIDMANKYLKHVEPLRDRGHTSLAVLLNERAPELPQGKMKELKEAAAKDWRRLKLSAVRVESLEKVVTDYVRKAKNAHQLTQDIQTGMVRILASRYAGRVANQTIELFDDPEPAQPVKAKAGVSAGAKVQLHHQFGRPLHFGIDALCDASGENAELFLQLAGSLVTRMETRAIRNLEPTLTPAQQESALQEKANDIIRNWGFPYARKVMELVDALANQCVDNAMLPNAPLGEGANTIGILEDEMQVLLTGKSELAMVLKYGLAYGAFSAVRDYGQGGKKWCLIELSGPVCIKYGLGFGRGNFLEREVTDLEALIAAGHS